MNERLILPEKFAKTAEEYGMFRCRSALVALSGGVDSTVLLHLMAEYGKTHSIRLYALHVHHGIRGAEADRDADFCERLCEKLAIPLETVRLDVPAMAAESGRGIEETAREARYAALEDFCDRMGIERIVTAHHADDNLETLLLNLVRGAGSHGGGGIAPVRGRIIRPLIACTRAQILAFAEKRGISYVEDSTNADPAYSRNFLRVKVIPLLMEMNPSLTDAALRFCRNLRQDDEALCGIADALPADPTCADLAALPPAIARRIVRSACERATGAALSADQTDALMRLIEKDREGGKICLSGGISAVVRRHRLAFAPTAAPIPPKSYRYPLHFGENPIPEIDAILCLYGEIGEKEEKAIKEKQNIYKLFIHRSIDFAKIAYSDLVMRNKADGDTICYGGMTRRVKKLLWERKIPADRRALCPVLADSEGILWIPGFPVCDRAAPRPGCRPLHLCFFANPPS